MRVAVDSVNSVLGVVQVDEDLPPPRDLPEITMLYVDPAVWGSRVAVQLLEAGLGWIATRGHTAASAAGRGGALSGTAFLRARGLAARFRSRTSSQRFLQTDLLPPTALKLGPDLHVEGKVDSGAETELVGILRFGVLE